MLIMHVLKLLFCALCVRAVPLPARAVSPRPTSEANNHQMPGYHQQPNRPPVPTKNLGVDTRVDMKWLLANNNSFAFKESPNSVLRNEYRMPRPRPIHPIEITPDSERLRVLKIGGTEENGPATDVIPSQLPAQYPQPPTSTRRPQGSAMANEVFTAVLPRPLNSGDKVSIGGKVSDGASQFTVNLATGAYNIDPENIAFRFQVNFSSNMVVSSIVQNGAEVEHQEEQLDPDAFNPGSDWGLQFEIHRSEIMVFVNESYHGQLDLKHSIDSIRYIQTLGHVDQVKTLSFEFA